MKRTGYWSILRHLCERYEFPSAMVSAAFLAQIAEQNLAAINLPSKTYHGEWAFVGEFVKQPGQ